MSDSVIIPPKLKEIFHTLARGEHLFLSDNGTPTERNYCDTLERNLKIFNDYLKPLGFEIHQGDGYYYLSSEETASATQDKMDRNLNLIQVYGLLSDALDGFEAGKQFKAAELEARFVQNGDLAERLTRVTRKPSVNHGIGEQMESLLRKFEKVGFIMNSSTYDRSFIVLSSINYLRSIILMLNFKD